MRSFRDIGRDKLKGVIDADETYFLISKKGQNPRGRKPRKRRGIAAHGGPTKEHVGVIVATDRNGRMTLQATGKSRVTSQAIIMLDKYQNISDLIDKSDLSVRRIAGITGHSVNTVRKIKQFKVI